MDEKRKKTHINIYIYQNTRTTTKTHNKKQRLTIDIILKPENNNKRKHIENDENKKGIENDRSHQKRRITQARHDKITHIVIINDKYNRINR